MLPSDEELVLILAAGILFDSEPMTRDPGFTVQRPSALTAISNSVTVERICRAEYRLSIRSFGTLLSRIRSNISFSYIPPAEVIAIGMGFLSNAPTITAQCIKFGLSNSSIVSARISFIKAVLHTFSDIFSPTFWIENNRLNPPLDHVGLQSCFGAIDGTHVPIRVRSNETSAYRTRKGTIAVNVCIVAALDTDILNCFTGFEGSAHDARVFGESRMPGYLNSLPAGSFLVADTAYPLTHGRILTPYRGQRYHLSEFSDTPPLSSKELFNLRHASLRNVVERTIGILKRRFAVLRKGFEGMNKAFHNQVVLSCCLLHNFLNAERRLGNMNFDESEDSNVNLDVEAPTAHAAETAVGDGSEHNRVVAQAWRDSLASRMWQDYNQV